MKTTIAAILAIILSIFVMAGPVANAVESGTPSAGTTVATELSEIPDGYDASDSSVTYIITVAG